MKKDISSNISSAVSTLEHGIHRLMNDRALHVALEPAMMEVFLPIRTLHSDYYMTRIRINCRDEEYEPWEMSYKPQIFNNTYQRASTPNKTMFYASSCERRDDVGRPFTDFEFGIIMALLETIPELRNESKIEYGGKLGLPKIQVSKDFEYQVTTSTWKVNSDIRLAQIAAVNLHDYEYSNYQMTQVLYEDYFMKFPEQRKSTLELINFISQEFSKPVSHESQYRISAIVSEIILDRGVHGVCYPSIRGRGAGINFAISPRSINSCAIELVGKMGLTVTNKNKKLLIL